MRYELLEPTIICARDFDDEVVVAHFGTGIYYSLPGTGAEIWRGLAASVDVSHIVTTLAPHSALDESTFKAAVEAFVQGLVAAQLVRPSESEVPPGAGWQPQAPSAGWGAPQIEHFSDMQELLLLDPVHDTSEAGWPYVVNA